MKIKDFTDDIILFTIIVLISGASKLSSSNVALVSIFIFFSILMLLRKKKVNRFMIIIITWWFIINLISFLYNKTEWDVNIFIGYMLWFLVPYMSLKLIGESFWDKLEQWMYVMALISVPLYLMNNIFPDFFKNLYSFFAPLTGEVFNRKETQATYWYGIFYTHSGRDILRNNGFMWESGAYAMILSILIIYNWCKSGIKLNRRIIFYLLILITTFSTVGYLAIVVFLIIYSFQLLIDKMPIKSVFVLLGILLFTLSTLKLDFMIPKINHFIEESKAKVVHLQVHSNRFEANRIYSFVIDFQKSLRLPLGYGIIEDKNSFTSKQKTSSVNGIGSILIMWGFPGLILVVISLYYFVYGISLGRYGPSLIYLFILVFLIVFFSNPIIRNPILFLLIFSPFVHPMQINLESKNNLDSL